MARRLSLLALTCLMLAGCAGFGEGVQVNSGSYDWTDQVRDAHGFPLPGWGDIIQGSGSSGGME